MDEEVVVYEGEARPTSWRVITPAGISPREAACSLDALFSEDDGTGLLRFLATYPFT